MFARKSRFAALLTILVLALAPLPASAQEEVTAEMRHLQEWLDLINRELKAELDQILALQQAQRLNAQMPELRLRSPDIVLQTDADAARRQALAQDMDIQERLSQLLERSKALDARKQQLLERYFELGSEVGAAPPPAEPAAP